MSIHPHFARIITHLKDKFAPIAHAESWDNVGLLVEAPPPPFAAASPRLHVLLTNDLTPAVFDECVAKGVGLVVAYHPLIFSPLKTVAMTGGWKQRIIIGCVQNGISVYVPHTSFDVCPHGSKHILQKIFAPFIFCVCFCAFKVNDWLAGMFEGAVAKKAPIVACKEASAPKEAGAGRLVHLKRPFSIEECVATAKAFLGLSHVRIASPSTPKPIESVAFCAGSGASVLTAAIGDADLLVTGEAAHHFVLDAAIGGSFVLLTEHSNSERGFLRAVVQNELLSLRNSHDQNWQVLVSDADADPLSIV